MKKNFLKKAIKRPGRVRKYLKKLYGSKAFFKNGNIKVEYLDKAERQAEKTGNTSLERAIILAKRLKRF